MQNKFLIYSDSSTDLPFELAKELEVNTIPLSYTINDKIYINYLDYRKQDIKEFYELIKEGYQSTTSQINPNDYLEVLTPKLDLGHDILILSMSKALSGTYNSGHIAVNQLRETFPDRKIEIIDTKSVSLGQGFLVRHAALERSKGKSIEEVKEIVLEKIPHMAHWFTVDDISHLRRSGRLSRTSSVVAKALNIKPVLHTDSEGKLVARTKSMGRKRAIKALFNKMKDTALDNQEIAMIAHGDDLESAIILKELVEEEYKDIEVIINYVGPVIGSHTGQGVLALFFLAEER